MMLAAMLRVVRARQVRRPRGVSSREVAVRAVLLIAVALVMSGAALRAEDRITTLDGVVVSGTISSISSQGQIAAPELKAPVELGAVRLLEHAAAETPRAAAVKVWLVGGAVVLASQITLKDEICTLDWAYGRGLKLPVDAVRGVQFTADPSNKERPKGAEALDKALAAAKQEQDQCFLIVDGSVQAISGLFEELNATELVFQWQNKRQTFARSKVFGLLIAPVGKPPERTGQSLVSLVDGSSLWATVLKLENKQLSLEATKGSPVTVPWEAVAKLAPHNNRLAFLSDQQPLDVVQETIVAPVQPWQRDRSVGGHPITLADHSYSKGLGVHSRCLLTFANDGFDVLAATVGIDAETHGKGDCVFIVSADGREVFNQRLRGSDAPAAIKVSVSGAKRITLAVEAGEDLDLADHADWADARLIREPAKNAAKP